MEIYRVNCKTFYFILIDNTTDKYALLRLIINGKKTEFYYVAKPGSQSVLYRLMNDSSLFKRTRSPLEIKFYYCFTENLDKQVDSIKYEEPDWDDTDYDEFTASLLPTIDTAYPPINIYMPDINVDFDPNDVYETNKIHGLRVKQKKISCVKPYEQ